MSKFIDIVGNRYNNLVVVERLPNIKGGITVWKCLCDCGNYTIVRGHNLKNGAVKSCGCLKNTTKPSLKHNMSNTRIYREWANMKRRCYTPSIKSYKDYGGRGITVCNEWKESFESFMKWALNNGYADNLTIERKDTNGNYCPENCEWIPLNQQQKNRRNCRLINYNGQTMTLTEWCKKLNLPFNRIHYRLYSLGWSFERAISEPVHVEKRNKNYA